MRSRSMVLRHNMSRRCVCCMFGTTFVAIAARQLVHHAKCTCHAARTGSVLSDTIAA